MYTQNMADSLVQSISLLSTLLGGEEVGKGEGKGLAQVVKLVPVLCQDMSVNNTSPEYIGR